MPITVQVTEDILSPEARAGVFADLTAAFLKHHDLTNNAFLTPNVIGEVNEIPHDNSFAGGKRADIAIVELKVPSFALASPEQKQAFIADATNTLVGASNGRLTPNRVWVNMVYAVDGLWGIGGRAYSNEDLLPVRRSRRGYLTPSGASCRQDRQGRRPFDRAQRGCGRVRQGIR